MGNVGETTKTKFLEPLQRNDVESVFNIFHPELQSKFELPVLKQFVRSMNETLGAYVKPNNLNIEKGVGWSSATGKSKNQGGELIFANGTLQYSVTFDGNDQIMAFKLASPNMDHAWMRQIETATYVQRSLQMINAFYAHNKAAVVTHMHTNLRQIVTDATLESMITSELNRPELGAFISVTPDDIPEIGLTPVDASDGEPKLILNFRIEREHAVCTGTVKWVFQSMKGSVIAFAFCKNVISVRKEPQPGDGKNLSKDVVQAVVDLNAHQFHEKLIKSLQDQTKPDSLAFLFKRNFSNGGKPTETVEESLSKAIEVISTMPNGFKAITVTGTLPYEQFNLLYNFVWVNGFVIEFSVKPDSTAHMKTDAAALAKEITEKTKTFIVKIIDMHKMSEAKALIDPEVVAAKSRQLDNTQNAIRAYIKAKVFDKVEFDIKFDESSSELEWKVPVKFWHEKEFFSGWVHWKLTALGLFITDFDFKSEKVIEWEHQQELRVPLWSALNTHGLRVFLEKGVNLEAADSNGFSDPYGPCNNQLFYKITMMPRTILTDKRSGKVKSKIIYKNLNPVWNELLTLPIGKTPGGYTYNQSDIIKIEVWDKDKIIDDFLGQVNWRLRDIITLVVEKGEVVMPFALKDKKDGNKAQGEIYLKFIFTSE